MPTPLDNLSAIPMDTTMKNKQKSAKIGSFARIIHSNGEDSSFRQDNQRAGDFGG
jgi:hypothetical protein